MLMKLQQKLSYQLFCWLKMTENWFTLVVFLRPLQGKLPGKKWIIIVVPMLQSKLRPKLQVLFKSIVFTFKLGFNTMFHILDSIKRMEWSNDNLWLSILMLISCELLNYLNCQVNSYFQNLSIWTLLQNLHTQCSVFYHVRCSILKDLYV